MGRKHSPEQFFNGVRFALHKGQRYFRAFTPMVEGVAGKTIWMHRFVWEHHNGVIAPGYQIHHRDKNTGHNAISNLECVTPKEHKRRHLENVEAFVQKAAVWHGTPEGRRVARKAGFAADKVRRWADFSCLHCGKKYRSRVFSGRGHSKFCSNACKSAARRKSGRDNVPRLCIICTREFLIGRYSRTKTCSRKCGVLLLIKSRGQVPRVQHRS